jgi:murein DD-endopeptidase MepM/ murein hydrolase activator NlpD
MNGLKATTTLPNSTRTRSWIRAREARQRLQGRWRNLAAGALCIGLLTLVAASACQPPPPAYAFILPRTATNTIALNQPHYAHPAVDIPVPVGTPFYAVTAATAITFDDAYCGYGVQLNADDGGNYVYCHASIRTFSGSRRVNAGTQLGSSGGRPGAPGAGNSSTPHLHFQLHYPASTLRCPQKLLIALYNQTTVPALGSLPTTGCVR